MFRSLAKDMIDGIIEFGGFALQRVQGETRAHLYVRFWIKDRPHSLCLGTFDKHTQFPLGDFATLSGLLSCFPESVNIVSLIGFPSHFGKILDHFTGSTTSVSMVPTLSFDDLCDLIRVPTVSVYGKADLFGLVDYLLIRLRDAANEPWVLNSTQLRIVGSFLFIFFIEVFSILLSLLFVKAIAQGKCSPAFYPQFLGELVERWGLLIAHLHATSRPKQYRFVIEEVELFNQMICFCILFVGVY